MVQKAVRLFHGVQVYVCAPVLCERNMKHKPFDPLRNYPVVVVIVVAEEYLMSIKTCWWAWRGRLPDSLRCLESGVSRLQVFFRLFPFFFFYFLLVPLVSATASLYNSQYSE